MLSTKKMAEKNLDRAAQMEPWNADPLFALGQLYKSENMMKKAREYFEKALEINMEHTLAGKAISEFGGLLHFKKPKPSLFGKKK
jgi:Tfp pilus assembly protein PilF